MPRGGGSRGGFRGGGFRGGFGGGFRGGGFRGGPATFRGGGVRPSGTPFGRTGATRIVSRPPSGPYRHGYYRPYYRYYGWGYRPWYWRWWYSPWWAGRWYRPWYYSPIYMGGGITFAIIFGLVLLPFFGIGLWFPFTNADSNGNVVYRSTETIGYNEYWYEYEYAEANSEITYSVQSFPSTISFAIYDQPFENLPTTNKVGLSIDSFDLVYNQYEYYWLFLRPGSSIYYNFTADNPVDFFIANSYQLYEWNQGGSPTFFVDVPNTTMAWGNFTISEADDYYLVCYNDVGGTIQVDYIVLYNAEKLIDFSPAWEVYENVTIISQDKFNVPYAGNWYFFIYFDPFYSPEASTTITFDVSYETGVTYVDRWINISWIFIIILVVIVIVIIAAFAARKGQKKVELQAKKQGKVEPAKGIKEDLKAEISNCPRCSFEIKPDANFCPKCGFKIEGRKIGNPEVITPVKSKVCSFCGSKLAETDKFCIWCGTPIETEENNKK